MYLSILAQILDKITVTKFVAFSTVNVIRNMSVLDYMKPAALHATQKRGTTNPNTITLLTDEVTSLSSNSKKNKSNRKKSRLIMFHDLTERSNWKLSCWILQQDMQTTQATQCWLSRYHHDDNPPRIHCSYRSSLVSTKQPHNPLPPSHTYNHPHITHRVMKITATANVFFLLFLGLLSLRQLSIVL